jgi:ADP-heptose:LPS heptosyltransferase
MGRKYKYKIGDIFMKRILFCTGEGIGNVIQTIPVLRTLSENGYTVDFWHAFGSFPFSSGIIPYIDRYYEVGTIMSINPNDYIGKVSTMWTKDRLNAGPLSKIKLLAPITNLTMDRSEVDVYMQIARDLGIPEDKLIWHGECNYSPTTDKNNIVISNGYNRHGSARWEIKSYPYYKELTEMLINNGYSVSSIGAKEEYVEGTVDKTGLPLMESLGLIKSSGFLLSNDTGMYHCANSLKVPNVVIFTATSRKKNYDGRFHKYSTLLYRNDLDCSPCQKNRRWAKDCSDWKCRDIYYEHVYDVIESTMARHDLFNKKS